MMKYTVNVEKIDWIDKENPEAEVLFKINEKKIWAFSHPCDFIENEKVEVYFDFIEDEIPEFTFWNENKKEKKEMISSETNRCKYYCYGQLKSIHPILVDCGDIIFSIGDWINDYKIIGSYVYFVIARLDINKV